MNKAQEVIVSNVGLENIGHWSLMHQYAAQAPQCPVSTVDRKRFAATGRYSLFLEHERHHHVHLVL
jgi:hypothetical protein